MTPEIILGAIVIVPVILLLFLRVNATLVFLSLCLGSVLVQFVAPEAQSFVEMFATRANQDMEAGGDTIKLVLLLLPAVLTTIFMIRTIKGRLRLILNLLPAAGVGLLGSLLVVPLLPGDLSQNITDGNLWSQLQKTQNLVVGCSALVCLFVLWLQRPKSGGGEPKAGKHKE